MALKVHYIGEEVEQHGRTFPVQIPWFTLEDVVTGQNLWCRRGNWRIDDPHGFFVSNDGWSVIHFHGRDRFARLTALSPEGQIVLTVGITGFDGDHANEPPVPEGRWTLWIDDHVSGSTAGVLWGCRHRCHFFHWEDRLHFVCRTEWGRYLVIDLENACVLDENASSSEGLFLKLRSSDELWALETLRMTCEQRQMLESGLAKMRLDKTKLPDQLAALWDNAFMALRVVRQEKTAAARSLLKELQSMPDPGMLGFNEIAPVNGFTFMLGHWFREEVHLAMLRTKTLPKGYSLRLFSDIYYDPISWSEHCLMVPECVKDREAILCSLELGIAPRDVVFRLGAPEFIRDSWYDNETCPRGDDFYFECWDYDQPAEDGTVISWALLWKRDKEPLSPEEREKLKGDFFEYSKYKEEHPDDPEAPTRAKLVSITRFVWDDAYWRMREEKIPIRWLKMTRT